MQFLFAATYVSRHRAETRLVAYLPPNHSGLGGFRGPLLPTYARLTARRTYSLRMAQFWDAYFIAISCNICASAKYWLTMPKLALPSRGIVPNWDQYHLPAEASRCTQFASTFCRSPAANSPGQPYHMAGTFLGPRARQNHQKGFNQ